MTDKYPKTPAKRQCSAKSKQTGKQCGLAPIPGGTVCKWHGGGAKQVKAKAQQRLAALVDPAIDQLGKLLTKAKAENVRLKAVENVLDRNGLRPPPVQVNAGTGGDFTLEELLVSYRRVSISPGAQRDDGE